MGEIGAALMQKHRAFPPDDIGNGQLNPGILIDAPLIPLAYS